MGSGDGRREGVGDGVREGGGVKTGGGGGRGWEGRTLDLLEKGAVHVALALAVYGMSGIVRTRMDRRWTPSSPRRSRGTI